MRGNDVGIYVHVPFCERICPYCDFAVVARRTLEPPEEARTVDALLQELEQRAPDFAGRTLASLYFGGGTPALLTVESIGKLVTAVRDVFPPAHPTPPEVTLETNPSTVERDRLPGFRAAGVDRLSLGVQSFDDRVLRRLGRAHRAAEVHTTLAACRAAGFERISLDWIYAAPDQDAASLDRDLAAIRDFGPEHVSAYELTLEPGTPFGIAAEAGKLALSPEEERIALHERVSRGLEATGLRRYEISSYARPGHEAVHNRRYWQRRPVLGLGMGAFSTDPPSDRHPHGVRRANPRGLEDWLASVGSGEGPATEPLPPEVARGEAMFLGLRTRWGVAASDFASEFGAPPRGFFAAAIDELCAAGLLVEAASGDLRPTERGLSLADSVAQAFV